MIGLKVSEAGHCSQMPCFASLLPEQATTELATERKLIQVNQRMVLGIAFLRVYSMTFEALDHLVNSAWFGVLGEGPSKYLVDFLVLRNGVSMSKVLRISHCSARNYGISDAHHDFNLRKFRQWLKRRYLTLGIYGFGFRTLCFISTPSAPLLSKFRLVVWSTGIDSINAFFTGFLLWQINIV